MKTYRLWLAGTTLILLVFQKAPAQVPIPTVGYSYSQPFTALGTSDTTWVNNSTLPGWYAASATGGLYTACKTGNGSSGKAGLYNMGRVGLDDRALGSINQDSSGDIAFGVLFQNNSGVKINSVKLAFRVEQWRKSNTTNKGHQRVKVAYKIASAVDVTAAGLMSTSFLDIPEAYLITLDTTTTENESMNGNSAGNYANVSVTFPVVLSAGQQMFIRFYDENAPSLDAALAVDNVQVSFSANQISGITASSGYSFFSYFDQGVVADIPHESSGYAYIPPVSTDIAAWTSILQNFYEEDWGAVHADGYGYALVTFTNSATGKVYHLLRKQNSSPYFWGSYVKASDPENDVLVLQMPHPIKDPFSARQGSAVFQITGAYACMVAGISRCASQDTSGCAGQSSICIEGNTLEPYRISDVAHSTNTIFNLATKILADYSASLTFVQLHGFKQDVNEPDFIVSCGTRYASHKSVPDLPVAFREALLNSDPAWKVKVTHADDYDTLSALDNVQGRYLNNYPGAICEGNAGAQDVTNRFLHIEQCMRVREQSIYYQSMADMIGSVVNEQSNDPYIALEDVNDTYDQNFNSLSGVTGTHTWGNNLHLPGWYAFYEGTEDWHGLFSNYRIGNGSTTSFGLYSYGNSAADRALGSLNQDASGDIGYGVLLKNKTGTQIGSVRLRYRAEQWRKANSITESQRVRLSYAVADSIRLDPFWLLKENHFTEVPAGDLVTIDDSYVGGAVNGNTVFSAINIVFPVALGDGQEIFIRFYDENTAGVDKAMAIDDLHLSVTPAIQQLGVAQRVAASDTQAVQPILFYKDGYLYLEGSHGDKLQKVTLYNALHGNDYAATFIDDGNDRYRIPCSAKDKPVLVVKLFFESGVYSQRVATQNR